MPVPPRDEDAIDRPERDGQAWDPGPWHVERLLAVGGMAEVWQGRSITAGGPAVAIKRLHSHLLRQPEMRELFVAEQRLCMDLPPHANLVRGLATQEAETSPYLVLSLAAGTDLRDKVQPATRGENAVSARAALEIMASVASAAAHLHDNGWVHGDIGPSNIIVADGGLQLRSQDGANQQTQGSAAVLCDLGVARQVGHAGPVRGTHAYMAPEQMRGDPWTPATDVFALAVCLWELLHGQRLFHRGPQYLTMAAVMGYEPPSYPDPRISDLLRRALCKQPLQRTPDAHVFLSEIQQLA